MALRSLGSSLVARSSPGAKLREQQEFGVTKPEIPGKGAPGSLQRQFVEEPGIKAVPPGSERVLTPTPGAEVESQATPFAPPALLAGTMGQPGAEQPGAEVPSGAQNQALFQGEPTRFTPSAAAPQARSQRTPPVRATSANLPGAFTGAKYQPEVPAFDEGGGENVGFQAQPGSSSEQRQPTNPFTSARTFIGGTVVPAVRAAAPAVLRSLGRFAPVGIVGGMVASELQRQQKGREYGQAMSAKPVFTPNAIITQGKPSLRSQVNNAASNLRSKVSNVVNKIGSFFRR